MMLNPYYGTHYLQDFLNSPMKHPVYPVLPTSLYRNSRKTRFSTEEALDVAKRLSIDWSKVGYDVEQFRMGLDVELEHGLVDPRTNVTNDDPLLTGKIALAHLNELPDYYTRLDKMEAEAKAYWSKEKRYISK